MFSSWVWTAQQGPAFWVLGGHCAERGLACLLGLQVPLLVLGQPLPVLADRGACGGHCCGWQDTVRLRESFAQVVCWWGWEKQAFLGPRACEWS